MAEITAGAVMSLRNETNLPMMECKQALMECKGDKTAALEWLSKKHKGKMEARSDKETGEGRVTVYIDSAEQTGAIIDLRCETAPVAKNEMFIEAAKGIAEVVAKGTAAAPSVDAVMAQKFPGSEGTVSDKLVEVYGKIRENMKIGECHRLTGAYLTHYVHHDGKTGVLLALSSRPTHPAVGRDLCMHVVFAKPKAIRREDMPADEIAKVRRLAEEAAREEGKPEGIVSKIAEGKVNAFVAENTLLDQEHVNGEAYGKKKIHEVLKEAGVDTITGLALVRVGV